MTLAGYEDCREISAKGRKSGKPSDGGARARHCLLPFLQRFSPVLMNLILDIFLTKLLNF